MSKSHPKAVIDALYSGDLKVIERYVNADNINLVDEDGHTLLSRAATASNENMKLVRLLVKCGADVNIRLREGGDAASFRRPSPAKRSRIGAAPRGM